MTKPTQSFNHLGLIGSVEYDGEVFHGKLQGIRDLVTYEAGDLAELGREFRRAVEEYLEARKGRARPLDSGRASST